MSDEAGPNIIVDLTRKEVLRQEDEIRKQAIAGLSFTPSLFFLNGCSELCSKRGTKSKAPRRDDAVGSEYTEKFDESVFLDFINPLYWFLELEWHEFLSLL